MPGLVPGIHVFLNLKEDVDGRDRRPSGRRSIERLCPAMTKVAIFATCRYDK
jgi:hypothetical protein